MTLLKVALKGGLLQVKEGFTNSLTRPRKTRVRQVCQDSIFSEEADRSPPVLKLHPAEFRHSFKPGFLLVSSECPKSAWSPTTRLLVTTNGKQSGTGLWAGSSLLTHQETCLPASPLPEHSSWARCICKKHPAPLCYRKLWVHARAAV